MKKSLVLVTFLFVSQAFGNICYTADEAKIPNISGLKIAKEICVVSASSDLLPFGYAKLNANLIIDGEAVSIDSAITKGEMVQGGYKIKSTLLNQVISGEVCGDYKSYTVTVDLIIDNSGDLIAVEKMRAVTENTNDVCHSSRQSSFEYF